MAGMRPSSALWEEVAADPRLREDPYTAALVSFNLGRVLAQLGDAAGAHRCRVRAMRLLESVGVKPSVSYLTKVRNDKA